MDRAAVINFNPGPSALPDDVLQEATKGLLNYAGTGMGITEISHRSKEFQQLSKDLASTITTLLQIPDTHQVLFTQGGASAQFSAIVLNLLARHRLLHPESTPQDTYIDYIVTGTWSKRAYEEGRRLAPGVNVHIAADGSTEHKKFDSVPAHESYVFSPPEKTAFIYYCENETVHGVQFSDNPSDPKSFPFSKLGDKINPPLIADFSSSFLSRPIPNLASYAMIHAGAQKNVGPAGLTILIVRKDLLVDVDAAQKLGATPVPLTMSFKLLSDHNSLYNTPPMFPMYVSLLVLQRALANGGLESLASINRAKQQKLYKALEALEADGKVTLNVQPGSRSWMNVTFTFPSPTTEQNFVDLAGKRGIKGIKGHRFVLS